MIESQRKPGERRVSAEVRQRRNGAEGMELNPEGVGGHRQNKAHSGIQAGASKRV